MPVYTYRCPKCKGPEERLVAYEDRDDQICGAGVIRNGVDEITPCEEVMLRDEMETPQRTPGKWG